MRLVLLALGSQLAYARQASERSLSPVEQFACLLREHRSPDSLVVLPLLLAAAGGRPGTFTELGAYDGETGSQTVHLERCFGWRGLLLEANPTNFAMIASKHRDLATVVHSAVCSKRGTVQVGTAESSVTGIEGIMSTSHQAKWRKAQGASVPVPCAPLGELMKETGYSKATFLSLDVEGAELDILQSLHLLEQSPPFSVLLVETSRYDGPRNGQILQLLKNNRTGLAQHSHPHFTGSQNALFAERGLKRPPLNHSAIHELAHRARAPGFIAALRALNVSTSAHVIHAEMLQVASAVPEVLAAALSAHEKAAAPS